MNNAMTLPMTTHLAMLNSCEGVAVTWLVAFR
jgi:hypothetical protein